MLGAIPWTALRSTGVDRRAHGSARRKSRGVAGRHLEQPIVTLVSYACHANVL